jgi:hypothetical protein
MNEQAHSQQIPNMSIADFIDLCKRGAFVTETK